MKTFIIGDIHGCYDELIALTAQLGLSDADRLIALGDIVDRGNQSKEVYEYFKKRPNSIVLMGNHERKHQKGILSYAQEIVKVQFGADYEAFLNWINTLGYYYETEEAIIIHSFFEHDVVLQLQKQEVLCGATSGDRYLSKKYPEGKYWTEFYTGDKPIIYGHHVVGEQPEINNNTYGIDTGACHEGYLTAIELPGFIIHQVKAKKDYWKEAQKEWQLPVLQAKNWQNMTFEEIDKQLDKLGYIEAPVIKSYLADIRQWKAQLERDYVFIKAQIDQLAHQLLTDHPETFSREANRYDFKTYLFKSKSNNLRLEDLQKGLNTPDKLMKAKKQLS
ncbi:MAG: metallophosphoesterase [Sphingobacteriales bacterium]|nr:MAG: metallophosphoesterase [Sphingobacteriales bacterium]